MERDRGQLTTTMKIPFLVTPQNIHCQVLELMRLRMMAKWCSRETATQLGFTPRARLALYLRKN